MSLKEKPIYSHRSEFEVLTLDGENMFPPGGEQESLARFHKKMEESRVVNNAELAERGRLFVQAVKEFAERYDEDVVIQEGLYYVEAVFRKFGGSYPKTYSRDFSELLSMCDRFSVFTSREKENSTVFSMECDTHDFYFGRKKFNDVW